MRSWRGALLVLLLSCIGPQRAGATVSVLDDSLMVPVAVAVSNASSQPVQFILTAANCRTQAPLTFTVPGNGGFQVLNFTWDFHDHGTNGCYTRHHYTEYTDAANPANKFRIVQSTDGGNNWYCNDIEYYAVFWIHQAVCPVVSGSIVTAQNGDGEATYCPPGVPYCPPYDNGQTLFFGVLVPQSGAAAAAPPLPPLTRGYDFSEAGPYKGSCVYDSVTIPPPLHAVWRPIVVPELGSAEVTAWLEPCVNTTPGDPYYAWEAEVLAVVRKQVSSLVSTYTYRIPYTYADGASSWTSSGERVVVEGPAVSTIVIPLRFDRRRIPGPDSTITANLSIAGVELSTDYTLPRGGAVVREYYSKTLDAYFMTADDFENPAAVVPALWAPTGAWWRVESTVAAGLVPVCRFWSGKAFYPRSSHVYTPSADECAVLKKSTIWIYESVAFAAAQPDAAAKCAAGTQALYRLYNNGRGGAPNHRYAVDVSVRDEMVRRGWVPEGRGADAIAACVPS